MPSGAGTTNPVGTAFGQPTEEGGGQELCALLARGFPVPSGGWLLLRYTGHLLRAGQHQPRQERRSLRAPSPALTPGGTRGALTAEHGPACHPAKEVS